MIYHTLLQTGFFVLVCGRLITAPSTSLKGESMKSVYYPDHDQRYAHLSEDERKDYPDELMIKIDKTWVTVIKRETLLT